MTYTFYSSAISTVLRRLRHHLGFSRGTCPVRMAVGTDQEYSDSICYRGYRGYSWLGPCPWRVIGHAIE